MVMPMPNSVPTRTSSSVSMRPPTRARTQGRADVEANSRSVVRFVPATVIAAVLVFLPEAGDPLEPVGARHGDAG